jgi:hypothetical protein
MPADQVRVWPEYKNIGYAGIYAYPGWGSYMPEYRDTCYDMPAYIWICRPNIFDILCRRRDAGLSDLQGWWAGI